MPEKACDIILHYSKLPLKVIFKSKHDPSNPYAIIKAEIETFVAQNKKEARKEETSIPLEVDF